MEKRYDVFISYSTQDQKIVEGICGFLEREGYRCFVAYRDIPRGVVWASAITDALDASKLMVVVFSGAFNMSKQTDREIEIASENAMPILTYRVADAKMTGAKKYYLKNLNWIDAFPTPENYFGRLLDSVVKLIGPSKIVADKAAQEEAGRLAKEEAERKAREAAERERAERERKAEEAKRKAEQERRERERAKAQRRAEKERSSLNENDGQPKTKKGLWIAIGAVVALALLLVLLWPKPKPGYEQKQAQQQTQPQMQQQTTQNTPTDGTSSGSATGFANGHEWVDLGLPSGTLWATCNIGASKPEDYGNYYAWGETSTKSTYNWESYKYANGTSSGDPRLTKYCNKSSYGNNGFTDNLTALQNGDDPATANWGSGWQTPSKAQWDELLENATHHWAIKNGVEGFLLTSKKNGQTLFLPAAGYRWVSEFSNAGSNGIYWSSSLSTYNPWAWYFRFDSSHYSVRDDYRCGGHSVRAVRSVR